MATYSEIISDQTLASEPFEKTARLLELVGEVALAQEARELGQRLRGVAEGRVDAGEVTEEQIEAFAEAAASSSPLNAICVPDPSPLIFWLENITIALDELRESERSADDRRIFQVEALEAPLDDLRPSLSVIEQAAAAAHAAEHDQGSDSGHSLG